MKTLLGAILLATGTGAVDIEKYTNIGFIPAAGVKSSTATAYVTLSGSRLTTKLEVKVELDAALAAD